MGKALNFVILVWFALVMLGGFSQGTNVMSTTTLVTAISASEDATITVTSTDGYANTGYIKILDEYIGYPSKTDTTFRATVIHDIDRGAQGSDNATHAAGEIVRTVESAMLNSSLDYQVATLMDASGILGFISIPFKFAKLLLSFFIAPLGFLGGPLQFLTYLWAVLTIPILFKIGTAVVGGRRV